jgi:hypothetical protein
MLWILADEVSKDELKQSWGGLIFMGLFVIAAIVVFIWWLKRQS